ncbi:MAG TPA: heterodisulfide reductase subunit B [Anaerolineae bacterium]|nr:heterodisulfide reductase subunit B [Anaerolineae bacterium]
MKLSYYPGCSLHSTAVEYGLSVEAVFKALGVELVELPDWSCCGASSAHSLNYILSLCLPARNLALAQERGWDLVAPCAACFNRTKTADYILRSDPAMRAEIEEIVGFRYTGQVRVLPPLGVVGQEVGLERVRALVTRPLTGLQVVSYYGCVLVRPPEVVQFENPEHPQLMDRLLEALGAQPMEWSYTTDCCGGSLSLTRRDLATHLVRGLVARAREAGAQAMVTVCPMCQASLEMRQDGGREAMPVFYFTELMGLAMGLEESRRWWGKHLIDPRPLLKSLGLMD